MLTSYNGWTASANPADFGGIEPLIVAGESFAPGVRKGAVHTVFSHFWTDYNSSVEPLYQVGWHEADEWGYAFRQNRNANNISCHGSATATDGNATRHPNGVPASKTFSQAQIDQIRWLCKVKYRGLLRWGGDFTGTPDSMHVEVIGTPAQMEALAAELEGGQVSGVVYVVGSGDTLGSIAEKFATTVAALVALNGLADPNKISVGQVLRLPGAVNVPPPNPAPQPWLMLPPVRSRPLSFQHWYNAYPFSPALLPIIKPVANSFGPQSLTALEKVQRRYGLVADGIDGPLTKRVLWDLGWRG